jgi:hypothetical protein
MKKAEVWEGEPVPSYRCCFLDKDRHTVKVENQDCTDDDSARRWAEARFRRLAQYTFVELWLDRRLVERRKRAPAVRQ